MTEQKPPRVRGCDEPCSYPYCKETCTRPPLHTYGSSYRHDCGRHRQAASR